jgi:two-component system, NtrC family, nitrogen regulation response regulator NtrX
MNKNGKILIVDDDPLNLEALHQMFIDDYEVLLADSGPRGLEMLDENPGINAIVLDIRMARMDGLETARHIGERFPDLPVIFHTGYPGQYSESTIQKEYKPFDYVGKNERSIRLTRAVENAVILHKLKSNPTDLARHAREQYGLVGHSPLMLEVYRTIEQIAPTPNKVMILGATGTGKELVARAIHRRSARKDREIVPFSCTHKSQELVESELFGHLKGAFTGAIADRPGIFEYADKGTVFLDEIGDLDLNTQGKLLRVLEVGQMQRVGSPEIVHVDVRLICATNRDLAQLVAEGKFRDDLYYRLKGVVIHLPKLSERRQDIPELIDYFIEGYCSRADRAVKVFDQEARDLLLEYDWQGNVRQLQDTVHTLIDLTPSYFITRKDVEKTLRYEATMHNNGDGFSNMVDEYKRLVLIRALDRFNGNVSAAARELQLDPSNMRKQLKNLDIMPE